MATGWWQWLPSLPLPPYNLETEDLLIISRSDLARDKSSTFSNDISDLGATEERRASLVLSDALNAPL